MKKLVISITAVIVSTIIGVYTYTKDKNQLTELQTANADILSDLEKYWYRKDWICETVLCPSLFGDYYATAPKQSDKEGGGTQAHSWTCITCQDRGKIIPQY